MEQIRERARCGLMAAPRVGLGVGGLLLGVRTDGRIRLLDSIEIPCSHSVGPSFNLTSDEKRETTEMVTEAGALAATGKVGVIGWYCSKIRGDATLNESDLSFYAELFPDSGQVALVVRPSNVASMCATFFIRDQNGTVVKGVEFVVEEWRPAPAVEPEAVAGALKAEAGAPPREAALSMAVGAGLPAPKAVETPKFAASPALKGPDEMPAKPRTPLADRASAFGIPDLTPLLPPNRSNKLGWILGAIAAIAAGAAAFATQDAWMPKPPLTLNSTELNGTLLIRWNPEALRGIDHASMFVNDGGQPAPTMIPLDRFQLNSGLLSYTPKSQRVTAKLNAGETSAITAWFATPPPVAPETASTAPPVSAPPISAPPAVTRDNARQETTRLPQNAAATEQR